MRLTNLILPCMALTLCLMAAPARACNVPVFRYALERWAPDAYVVTVFHKGPLTEAQGKDVELLRSLATGVEAQMDNYFVDTIDIDGPMSDQQRQLLAATGATGAAAYPWMHVQYPRSLPKDPPAYSGALSAATIRQLVDSPARREIAKLLLEGESVVWLLVECGDKVKDDAAAALLQGELTKLMKELKLPKLTEDDVRFYDPKAGPPLKLSFKMVRLSRQAAGAAGEAMFLNLLENWNPKDRDPSQPTAFAFFGRGRVLPPMYGKHLEPGLIGDACAYLIGACSCQVKEENPGYDVLMSVNWDGVIRQSLTLAEALPKLTTPAAVQQQNQALLATSPAAAVAAVGGEQPVDQTAGEQTFDSTTSIAAPANPAIIAVAQSVTSGNERQGNAILRNTILVATGVLVIVAAGTVTLRKRRSL